MHEAHRNLRWRRWHDMVGCGPFFYVARGRTEGRTEETNDKDGSGQTRDEHSVRICHLVTVTEQRGATIRGRRTWMQDAKPATAISRDNVSFPLQFGLQRPATGNAQQPGSRLLFHGTQYQEPPLLAEPAAVVSHDSVRLPQIRPAKASQRAAQSPSTSTVLFHSTRPSEWCVTYEITGNQASGV
jgi:hypothetical protein